MQTLLVVVTLLILVGFHEFGCFGCHKDELYALLQLKSAINYPNGTALPHWKEEAMGWPSDCCHWDRVECGESDRVVALHLDYVREADWYLNASLFLPFPHLQALYLMENSITGWTHHLSSLEVLDLSYNKLKGMIDLYDVEALQNLKSLDLSGNNVDGFKIIHGNPRNTSKLQTLGLMNVTFQDANTLLDSLVSFPSLKILEIEANNFNGVIETTYIEALQNLKELYLDDSNFDGFKRVHGGPCNTSKLETLGLTNVTFQDAYMLLDSLVSFPSLNTLYLSNNDFKGVIETTYIEALQNLKELYLGNSNFDGFKRVHGSPRNTSKLEELDLSGITFQNASTLLDSLVSFPSLKTLYLGGNDFSGVLETTGSLCQLKKIQELANSPLTKLTSLQSLSLLNNKFQIPQTFRSFANQSSLKFLLLDGNDVIPDYAPNQPFIPKFQLSFLSLSNCNIRATIPSFILHQYSLTYLDLSHNYIDGSFPAWIVENNTFLLALRLANNSLIGSLHLSRHPHSQIKSLDVSYNKINYLSANLSQSSPNIQYLNFSKNSIKALTPSTFGDMKNLNWLDLSYNDLTGEMPKGWIKHCFSLKALFLSQNALEVIPSLPTSSSLRFLLFNNNNFSGMIPSSLLPTSLELLDLSSNHLGGQIPTEMCKLNNLLSIDLSHNSFSGFLPPCFNSPYLLYVYLNKNQLNSPLLSVFKNNTSLATLDLGDNYLFGVIPEWIGNLRSLSILSLKNNNFEGHLPTQICFMDQLTILDLSSNSINGQIPHCLSQIPLKPNEIKSNFEERDVTLYNPSSDVVDLEGFTVFWNSEGFFSQYITFHKEMEITTKSHTYNYAGTDLDDMAIIDLACNKFSGEIPPEIGSMINVRALNLSHNKLTDSIPLSLSKLSQIESLDLSYNNLNGSIPSELIDLNALAVFSVAHNNLSGRTPEQKAQFGTFGESSYEGNPFLCGPPLLNDCSPSSASLSRNQSADDFDGSMDMDVFYICFSVSSMIMFLGTLIVLWVNPHWRRVWFYYGEMWITWVYYFVVDNMGKGWNQVFMLG